MQEIGTSAPATLFWGELEVDWQVLHKVCEGLTNYHHLRKAFDIQTAKIKYIFQRFIEPDKTSRHANRFSFMYELHRGCHLKVTDPRDRVFAMLGHYSVRHGSNKELKDMRADYTKTLEEVYIDVAARSLTGDHESLITLAAIQHMDLPSKIDDTDTAQCANNLPSWVPDWRTFQGHILSEPTSPHRACGSMKPDVRIDPLNNTLHIRGILLDTVKACSEGINHKAFNVHSTHEIPIIQQLWYAVCGHTSFDLNPTYLNGESALFAFAQTLSNACVATSWQEHRPYDSVPTTEWLAHAAAYLVKMLGHQDGAISQDVRDMAAQPQSADKWSRAASGAASNRKFARTEKGYYVLGPKVMEVGDMICVLFGGKMPFVLRPRNGRYLFAGECYIHGVMEGELLDADSEVTEGQEFLLV